MTQKNTKTTEMTAEMELELLKGEMRKLQEIVNNAKVSGTGRLEELIELMRDGKERSLEDIAKAMKIKTTNVSSVLAAARKKGYVIENGFNKSIKRLVLVDGEPLNHIEKAKELEERMSKIKLIKGGRK